ncbi:MAG TPA: hypothetical protein P5567_08215 [Kiritimatiellia bacterium]|nr:hypothetical protein [Kiritimatiellia bacterium]HRZ12425.1 hypothetical protein [Kiritimatiellia bacterium]HSA17817.1 hypothetical protein [Kiritimatiellia bacterium]
MAGHWRSGTASGLIGRFGRMFPVMVSLGCAVAGAGAGEDPHRPAFHVGYQILDLPCRKEGVEHTLTVAVWYPTAARPRPHHYGGLTRGRVAVDAAPDAERGPYPLLVFSHGYGGSGLGVVFLAEALAARGWIVAAPDHHDRHSAVRIREGPVEDYDRRGLLRHSMRIAASGRHDRADYMYRLDEMQLVLDRLSDSEPFGRLTDPNRVAVGGHSFGGFTALGVCGTIPERFDPRIKAVLLFSTGAGGYLFSDDELAAVRIPSMLFLGELEKESARGSSGTMAELSGKVYRNLPVPKYFLEVKGANHLSFNNSFAGRTSSRPGADDSRIFDVIRRYSIAFLEKHVAARGDDGRVLERGEAMLTRYLKEP